MSLLTSLSSLPQLLLLDSLLLKPTKGSCFLSKDGLLSVTEVNSSLAQGRKVTAQ